MKDVYPRSEDLVDLYQQVKLVGQYGKELGLLSLSDAMKFAEAHGAGLVRIAGIDSPPAYRVINSRQYQELLKNAKAKRRQR
jgi:translation initiation factor IF-3